MKHWCSPLRSSLFRVVIVIMLAACSGQQTTQYGSGALDPGQQRLAEWESLIRNTQNASELDKLTLVNNFFNQLAFVDDLILWGQEDYWATPQETLVRGGGDCEDFATAKYFTLLELKIAQERLRLIYVKSLTLNQAHMVLGCYAEPGAEPLVLDNVLPEILVASKRMDLVPIYSFNNWGYWVVKEQQSNLVGGADRLSLWRDLRTRFTAGVFTVSPASSRVENLPNFRN